MGIEKKWYRCTCLQGRNRDADREGTCGHSGERGGWDELGEKCSHTHTHTHTLPCVSCCVTQGAQLGAL